MNFIKMTAMVSTIAMSFANIACKSNSDIQDITPVTFAGKSVNQSNPLIGHMYCADPTAVEYEGRLFVYGTNDHQQYLYDKKGNNNYGRIKSLIMISTDDMVNWTYHGTIPVDLISPRIIASWAPSIVSRVEEDGKTHFYLYFSNSGWGTGVLTATSPTGPWTDPLGRSIVDGNTKGPGDFAPFDPGVVIDDNGTGWMAFGGSPSGDDPDKNFMPGGARIVKLGDDMISFASEITEIPAPYHNEAAELNYINGTYIYTYCTNWVERKIWNMENVPAPTGCCMSYMTTKTPLDPDSWVYRGNYFKNPGEQGIGLDYSNNHTHIHKYNGQYYLFYHDMRLQKKNNVTGGFRNISVDLINVNEETLEISMASATLEGVSQIKKYNPYIKSSFTTTAVCAGIEFKRIDFAGNMYISAEENGSWILVRGVDFQDGAKKFTANVKGQGRIEIRLDDINSESVAFLDFSASDWKDVSIKLPEQISGERDLFFLFSKNVDAQYWFFTGNN